MSQNVTPAQLHQYFVVRKGRLVWLPRPGLQKWNTRWAGKRAGGMDRDGRLVVSLTVNGYKRLYLADHILAAMKTGVWDETKSSSGKSATSVSGRRSATRL